MEYFKNLITQLIDPTVLLNDLHTIKPPARAKIASVIYHLPFIIFL
jgi:hypothetical protein